MLSTKNVLLTPGSSSPKRNSNHLTRNILYSMLAGIALGVILYQAVDTPFGQKYLVGFVFKLGRNGFVNLIQRTVVKQAK